MLLKDIEEVLGENGFDYCEYSGCFDIAAKNQHEFVLLKVLDNVDSFQEEQANNLKVLSRNLDAKALVVGSHTRRERLSDNIVYDRFDVPTVNLRTLDNILHGLLPFIYRYRGGLFTEIDPAGLKKSREDMGLSQSELASKAGVTKKSIYEHEKKRLRIVHKTAVRLEKILKSRIIRTVDISTPYAVEGAPRSSFESNISKKFRSIGFGTDSVYQTPFNLIAKDKSFMLISDVEESKKQIEKNLPHISSFANLAGKSAVIITKEEINTSVPSISEKELAQMKTKDIKRMIRKW